MGSASIGIKLADSKFFSVLEEGEPTSKVLDLTTVRDNQTSVQINLFRNENTTPNEFGYDIDEAEYIGTLIIEDIAEKSAGDPTIELTLSLDSSNELSAEAVDLDSGSRQVLTVSLETLDRETLYDLPDFNLSPLNDMQLGDDPDHKNVVIEGAIPGNAPKGLYQMDSDDEKKNGIFMPAWLCILILVIGVLALALALIVSARTLLVKGNLQDSSPSTNEAPLVPTIEPAETIVAEPEAVTPPPVEETPEAVVVEEPAAVPVQPEPSVEAKATRYKIKWGDTLWDISTAYYKTPWLYTQIAKYNKIRNPNLIISGTYLEIPPK
jgi:LysM repeat protein